MDRLIKEGVIINTNDTNTIVLIINKLISYENTGLTPEAILEINDSYSAQIDIANDLVKDRDYWKRKAITASAKLGEIRILLEMKGV
jgi:hypothetical protein